MVVVKILPSNFEPGNLGIFHKIFQFIVTTKSLLNNYIDFCNIMLNQCVGNLGIKSNSNSNKMDNTHASNSLLSVY